MERFQAWSQKEAIYDGRHGMDEAVMTVTVEDVLWAMYTEDIELSDDNLDEMLGIIRNGGMYRGVMEQLEYLAGELGQLG